MKINELEGYKPGTHLKKGQRKRILVEKNKQYVAYRYPSSKNIKKEDVNAFLTWAEGSKVKPR